MCQKDDKKGGHGKYHGRRDGHHKPHHNKHHGDLHPKKDGMDWDKKNIDQTEWKPKQFPRDEQPQKQGFDGWMPQMQFGGMDQYWPNDQSQLWGDDYSGDDAWGIDWWSLAWIPVLLMALVAIPALIYEMVAPLF